MNSITTALQNDKYVGRVADDAADIRAHVESTDAQLVELVLAGDNTAFEQIFDRHKRMVAMVTTRYFRRPEEIEEIIQISFAKAFVELERFRGQYDRSLMSWLARITANACLDLLRSQRRKPERLDCELADHEKAALLELTSVDIGLSEKKLLERDLIDKVLAQMPESDRALLQMMYADEMSVADIAETLGCSKANVKVRAWRARASMRKLLQKIL